MKRRGFTLVELLVVVSIILVLMTLIGAAVSGARTSIKTNATIASIQKLNAILVSQLATYDSRNVNVGSLPTAVTDKFKYKVAQRAWYIRRNMISGDLPDRWTDVAFMGESSLAGKWAAQSGAQRSYIAIYNGATAKPSAAYSGAECLFMIVMQGGIADCLDCGALKTTDIGDKDNDGFMEFWDAWGNPIGFILWAPAYKLSGKDILFFTSETLDSPTGQASVRPALGMRPLIYSAGPDGEYGLNRNDELATLSSPTDQNGANCGDWTLEPTKSAAAPDQKAADNITNLDLEPK